MIVHIATNLILRLSTCQEVPTSDWDVIDLNLSYDQVIFGLCWHWRLPNTYNLTEERIREIKLVSLTHNNDSWK